MKTRKILLLWLSIAFAISINAQNFTDNFNNETVNSIASQWGVVKGMAVIGELDGKKVLSLDRYTVAKPIVNGEDKNYLGDQFTIEFDAFFHEVPSVTRHYYIIHLWDGTGVYGENGEHTDPYKIYRHGISTSGTTVNRNRIEELGVLEQTWRHVKIAYANKTLKMFINGHLVLNHPNLFFDPPLVSFSARNASGKTSGITNISITGQVEGGDDNTDENPDDGTTIGQDLPYTFPEFDGEANQILQTDGNGTLSWVDFGTKFNSSGLVAIDEGNGIGWRLADVDKDYVGKIGKNAVDLSRSYYEQIYDSISLGATGLYSFASGAHTTASQQYASAFGRSTAASGDSSTSFGMSTIASGHYSTTFGENTKATSRSSIAFNYHTKASGQMSTAFGMYTKAEASGSFVLGSYNLGGGDPYKWRGIEPLFEIGNGEDDINRSNALTVLKNGNIGIGTHTPQVKLHIQEGLDANNSKGGYLIIGDKQKENIVFDNNEIIARNNVQPAILYLQSEGGDVYVGRAIVHSSDKRLKQDIENLSYGLDEILQLRPVSYHWKTNPNARNKSLGLIAQEVQPILKELITVNTNNDNDTLGVNYTELIPILIKAIQEQQSIIRGLKTNMEDKDEAFNQLNERMKRLESLTINSR